MTRRTAIASVIAIAMIGSATFAFTSSETTDEAVEKVAEISAPKEFQSLDWGDLSPPRSAEAEQAAAELNLRIDYMSDEEIETALSTIDRQGKFLVDELDDKDVSLVGYLVPLDFEADKTDEFVLVPYFGACIHVPPPPPNQIVYVKFREGLALSETRMYSPFRVEGRIKAAHAKTELANVGYQLTASDIIEQELQ